MRRMLLAVLLSAACARTPPGWPENQKKQFLSLSSGCLIVAHETVGAKDPEACCAAALPSAERNFPSYGDWHIALFTVRDTHGSFYGIRSAPSAALQNWYADLSHCEASK